MKLFNNNFGGGVIFLKKMDPVQEPGSNQPSDSSPDTITKTKVDTKLRTAVLVIGGLAVLAAAGISISKIAKSGDLNVYREYDSPPAGTVLYASNNSQYTLFSAGFYPGREDVKVSKIEFTFLAQKGFKGNLKDMFKNLTLYKKVYNYGYGYGYNYSLEAVGKLSALGSTANQAKAKFDFSSPLLFKLYDSTSLVLVGEIPSGAPEGNFSIQIANANDISAVGAKSNRKVKANVDNAKGDWLTVKKASPALKVSLSPTPALAPAIKGTVGHTFAYYDLSTAGSEESIVVNSLELAYEPGSNDPTSLTSCQLFDGTTSINHGVNLVNPASGSKLIKFIISNLFVMDKGINRKLALKCNVSGSAKTNSVYSWGIDGQAKVEAYGLASGQPAKITVVGGTGTPVTISSGGSYSVSLDSSSPQSRLLVGGTNGNTMTVLRLKAASEQISVNKIRLGLSSLNSSSMDLGQIYIYDGLTLLASGMFLPGGNTYTFSLVTPIKIPANGEKIVTVKADIAPIYSTETIATSGHGITIDYLESSGIGEASGTIISNNTRTNNSAVAYIYRSVPTVSKLSLPGLPPLNGYQIIYKFKVLADAKGDVDLYKVTFSLKGTKGLKMSDLNLFDTTNGKSYYPFLGQVVSFDSDIDLIFSPIVTLAAGNSSTFELRATISEATTGSVIIFRLLGDDDFVKVLTASQVNNQTENDFIWSDRSKPSHSVSTADWINGYLVPGLPAAGLVAEVIAK